MAKMCINCMTELSFFDDDVRLAYEQNGRNVEACVCSKCFSSVSEDMNACWRADTKEEFEKAANKVIATARQSYNSEGIAVIENYFNHYGKKFGYSVAPSGAATDANPNTRVVYSNSPVNNSVNGVASVYKGIAWTLWIIGCLAGLVIASEADSIVPLLIIGLSVFLGGIGIYAVGEIISKLHQIEINTRR